MIGKVVHKVPGGKLLKVTVEHDGKSILKASISGDFFIHPEDSVDRLEARLRDAKPLEVGKIVESSLSGARLFGVDAKSITDAILEAYGGV
ncbi:MAG: hypothetical protein V1875_02940 [Candidatus Altiarchaeota archaeon]